MIYISDLKSSLPADVSYFGKIHISDIHHSLNINGKLEISLGTNSRDYEDFLQKLSRAKTEKVEYIDIQEVVTGDEYDIFYRVMSDKIEEFWIHRFREKSWNLLPKISVISEPTHCPVCEHPLVYEEDGLYCFNSLCPAKIKMTIRKFLYFVSNGTIVYQDFKFLDQLIFKNIIQSPLDLYRLTEDHLLSLGCKLNVANEIISVIQSSLGTVPISTYLKSLNVGIDPRSTGLFSDRLVINDQVIDTHFKTIHEFLDWWKFIFSTPGQSPYPYMDDISFIAISNFLSYPENIEIMMELDILGFFRYS